MSIAAGVAKNSKVFHPKSRSRDALSAQAFEGVAAAGGLGVALGTSVTNDNHQRSKWKPGESAVCKTRTTPHERWLETVLPTTRAHVTATPWRDARPQLRVQMAHWVLVSEGDVTSFTLNLGPDVKAQALSEGPKAKDWIAERLVHHLKTALGRKPHFWFNLEMSEGQDPYLHLHGEIACSDAERDAVRKAMRKAGGKWLGPKQFQIRFGKETPDTGWVSYSTKPDLVLLGRKISAFMSGRAPADTWRDHRFYIERGLGAKAKATYTEARSKLKVETTSIRSLMQAGSA